MMKTSATILMLIGLLTNGLLASSSTFAQPSQPVPLIVDTDMGTDDWIAIAYLAQNQNVDLLGVTVVGNGLASCAYAVQNARQILSMSVKNANKPVGCGSIWPLDGYASYPQIWRSTGADMMGEARSAPKESQTGLDSTQLMVKLLREARQPVDILAIGSLTNIATLIRIAPELKPNIRQIISMGGAVKHAGNLRVHGFTDDHTNTAAEWNYYIDPVAAKIVFESGVPIRLIPLDATNRVPLTKQFADRFDPSTSNPLKAFVQRVFQKILVSTTNGEYFHWDPLAAAIAVHPELCDRFEPFKLSVIADPGQDQGLKGGQPQVAFPLMNYLGGKRNALSHSQAGATVISESGNDIMVCMHADAANFEKHFHQTMRMTQ